MVLFRILIVISIVSTLTKVESFVTVVELSDSIGHSISLNANIFSCYFIMTVFAFETDQCPLKCNLVPTVPVTGT